MLADSDEPSRHAPGDTFPILGFHPSGRLTAGRFVVALSPAANLGQCGLARGLYPPPAIPQSPRRTSWHPGQHPYSVVRSPDRAKGLGEAGSRQSGVSYKSYSTSPI